MSKDTHERPKTDGPHRAGALIRHRKVAIIALVGAVSIAAVISLFGIVYGGSDGLVVRMDEGGGASDAFAMFPTGIEGKPAEEGTTYMVGDPLNGARQTSTQYVRNYYSSELAWKGKSGELSGSNNYIEYTEDGEKVSRALVYTFYLKNNSTTEETTYRIQANITSQTEPVNGSNNPYDYLRVALYEGNVGYDDDYVRYFGAPNTKKQGTYIDGVEYPDDNRECIGAKNIHKVYDDDGNDLYTLRSPAYYDDSLPNEKIGFCENFHTSAGADVLFSLVDQKIAPGATRRITFISYLEGDDPDAYGTVPIGAAIGLNLIVGV